MQMKTLVRPCLTLIGRVSIRNMNDNKCMETVQGELFYPADWNETATMATSVHRVLQNIELYPLYNPDPYHT